MKIVLTGGGTGGHVFPLIAVARKLTLEGRRQNIALETVFIGPRGGSEIFEAEHTIRMRYLTTGKLRRYFSLHTFVDFPKIALGLVQAYVYLLREMPDIIFSKGGYGSFPVVIIAGLFRIPIVIHESDSVIGLTNTLLNRLAGSIIVSFPTKYSGTPPSKIVQLGNPVRDMRGGSPGEAQKEFGLVSNKPVILVLGGSQGAVQINEFVLGSIKEFTQRYEIIHQTGEQNFQGIQETAKKYTDVTRASYHPLPFLNEAQLKNALAAASLVISRAGANAIFEIALVGKPSILIPLPTAAAGHQEKNAILYERAGACIALDPENITPHIVLQAIQKLLEDKQRTADMTRAAYAFARPNSAEEIAKYLITYAQKSAS